MNMIEILLCVFTWIEAAVAIGYVATMILYVIWEKRGTLDFDGEERAILALKTMTASIWVLSAIIWFLILYTTSCSS